MSKKSKIVSLVTVLLLVVLVVMANVWRRQSPVKGVRVDVDYGRADTLVEAIQVEEMIRAAIPGLMATKLRDVDLEAVERVAATSPFLTDCKAGTSIGGEVVVFATQRRPIVRICTSGRQYYLDNTGHELPDSEIGWSDVIVASGSITPDKKSQKEVWTIANYLDNHPDLSPLFDQIYRDDKGDLYLTPKLGNHVVQLGNTENLDDKFHRLMAIYQRGLTQVGWEKYSQLSVKYRGQVVCTRRQNAN